jgi:predicted phage tail component-like protein
VNRLTEAWFEFKNTRSTTLGILMAEMPQRTVAARNSTRKKVAGRSGRIRTSDGSYDDITIQLKFDARDESKLRQIDALLTGSGPLRFSDDAELIYDAVIEASPSRQSIRPRFGGQTYTVKFICAPFKTLYTPAQNIVKTASGETISNPGTAPALPRIAVVGSGSFSLTIGAQTMFFEGVTDGIVIDSQVGDVFTADGTLLANDKAAGELFAIQPGTNTVSWIEGGTDDEGQAVSGSVTSVTITPRWRYV